MYGNTEENIERINKILRTSEDTTPSFIRGLLIPEHKLVEFYWLIELISKDAKDAKELWDQIQETTVLSQKSTHDFMTHLIENVKDGKVIIKTGKSSDDNKLKNKEVTQE